MKDGWTSKTTGLGKVTKRITSVKQAPKVSAIISMSDTTGVYRRKGGPVSDSRSAGDNITILRTQAKRGRKLAKLTKADRTSINAVWKQAASAFMRSLVVRLLLDAAQQVAVATIAIYRSNTSKLKPVKPSTQRTKDREGIAVGLPPLVRTGQLLKSFAAKAKRR